MRLWGIHPGEGNLTSYAEVTILYNEFKTYAFKIITTYPSAQRVDMAE